MDEVVLGVDQPVGHLQGGVDDLLALGRALAVWQRWQRMVDGVHELAHRLDSGPLTLLKGIEYLFGQLFGLVDRRRGTRSGRAALSGRGGLGRRAAFAGRGGLFAILGSPRGFVLGVASWQALARLIRLAGLACFMAAMGLPITLDTVTLAMAAQGAGWIVPIAPASAGIRVALLSYGFIEITHSPVDIGSITGFWLILGATQLIANVTIGIAAIYLTFGTTSPRRALAIARRAANPGVTLRGTTGKPAPVSKPGQLACGCDLRELGDARDAVSANCGHFEPNAGRL